MPSRHNFKVCAPTISCVVRVMTRNEGRLGDQLKKVEIRTTKKFDKQYRKLDNRVKRLVNAWTGVIKTRGLEVVRRVYRGRYQDKLLEGKRFGQRAIRLNKSYRLFYTETVVGKEVILEEVNKHDY